jgi:hypothetical protein
LIRFFCFCLILFFSTPLFPEKEVLKDLIPLNMRIVSTAREFKGLNYSFGSNRIASGLDCSSFVQKIYGFYGVKLPRVSSQQFQYGKSIDRIDQLVPGDLVFFETYRPGPSHVGIYSDKVNYFIHAGSSLGVTESNIYSDYFRDRYYGAKRVLEDIFIAGLDAVYNDTSKPTKSTKLLQKKAVKTDLKTLQKIVQEVANFQENKKFLQKQKLEIKSVQKFVNKNKDKISSVCPVIYDKVVKTYVYDTTKKTSKLQYAPKFGEVIYVIGGSKELNLGKHGKLITRACVTSKDKKIIDLIDSRVLSFFPPKGLIDKNCLDIERADNDVVVSSKKAKLRLYDNDYENVFGNLVNSYRLDVATLNKGTKLKSLGVVKQGKRKGDHCVHYNGNIVIAYEGDIDSNI